MAAHIPSGGYNPNLNDPIGTTPTHIAPTYFNTPEFRSKIVQILSQTANGCLRELNLHPNMTQEITELKSRIDHYHEKNTKLYEDNKNLVSMVKEARTQLSASSNTVKRLEQQVATLHKVNQDVLIRERSLTTGNPAYIQLQSDYMHLSKYCTQLKQQIGALQRMVFEKPPLPHAPCPSQHPLVFAEGGQPLPIRQATHPTHEAARRRREYPHLVQSQSGQTNAFGQDRPPQEGDFRSSLSRPSVATRPGPLNQPQGNHRISVPQMHPLGQFNQPMINNASPKLGSPPGQSASRTSAATRIRPLETNGLVPTVKGWVNETSFRTTGNHHRLQNPSIHSTSVQHGRSPSAPLHSPSSFSRTGPAVDQNNENMRSPSFVMRPPDVNVPPGTNFVPIGPPGKLLSPLTASVMKRPASPSRPPSARASPPSGTMYMPEPARAIGNVNPPPLDTSMHVIEHSRTPNLTPTSSRNSAAPSEGELEATTPLDDYVNHAIKVVKSPMSEAGVQSDMMVLEDHVSVSSLKRSNSDIQVDENGSPSDVGESPRKRLKMSADVPSERDEDDKMNPTNSPLPAMDEGVGEEEEEEEEFGPDGKPSLEYYLDAFTEEDGDVDVCALCRLRQKSGLILNPTVFSPNATQEAKVQHFLDEHPTAWENMINGRGCS